MSTPAEEFGALLAQKMGTGEQAPAEAPAEAVAEVAEELPRLPKSNAAQGTSGGTPGADPTTLFAQEMQRQLRW